MSIGVIILFGVGLLIYFGLAQRVLDKLYLTDTTALALIALIIVGSYFEIPLYSDPLITFNPGGALIPILLAIYVLAKTSTRERLRTILAILITGGTIFALSLLFKDFGHGRDIIDPMYLFALSGGLIAYVISRSRRGAFIAGSLGYLTYELINLWQLLTGKVVSQLRIGGAGAFDSIIISGVFAVLLAELIGELRERLQGGHHEGGNKNEA